MGFRRTLSPKELGEQHLLAACFPIFSEKDDSVAWPHTTSGRFSVKSLYLRLVSGAPMNKSKSVWLARVPPKVKTFMWQAIKGRLPAADQIHKRNDPWSDQCALL